MYFGGNSCCGQNYSTPYYGGWAWGNSGYNNNSSSYAIILVLFILLVIVIGSRFTR